MVRPVYGVARGLAVLFWLNLRHYSLALWGVRLRLDPDYPGELRFRPDLIVDAVLEYRGYGLLVPVAVFLARLFPIAVCGFLVGSWAVLAWRRAYYYSSPYRFWTRAYEEAPGKPRNQTRYAEELMREIERRMKAGQPYGSPECQFLIKKAMEMEDLICNKNRPPLQLPDKYRRSY